MRTVQQIYKQYKIMPNLQQHQLRVAAVAKIISDEFGQELDTKSVILACLFHDMGNIIKSDLARFPDFMEPRGIEYWQKIKDEFISKYGPDEHVATKTIAIEIGLEKKVLDCLDHIGFSNLEKNMIASSFENKICNYADMRVGPYGVISMEDRFVDGKKRYAGKIHTISSDKFEYLANCGRDMEKQIFEGLKIRPEDVNDQSIINSLKDLKNTEINESK